jgi:hypothetical protein
MAGKNDAKELAGRKWREKKWGYLLPCAIKNTRQRSSLPVYFSLAHGKENAGNLPHAGKQWCAWERDVYVTLILCRVSVRGHAAKPYRCNNSTKCISKGHVAPLFVVFLFSVVCIFGVFPCLLLCRLFSQFCCVYTLRRLFFWCFVVFLFIDMCPPMRSTTKGRAFWSTVKLWKHGKREIFL